MLMSLADKIDLKSSDQVLACTIYGKIYKVHIKTLNLKYQSPT